MHTKAFWMEWGAVSTGPGSHWARGWGVARGVARKGSHLADQGAELCGAQVPINTTENGDCDHDITQDAAQIVKGVDTHCRRHPCETREHVCAPRGAGSGAGPSIPRTHVLLRTHVAKVMAPLVNSSVRANVSVQSGRAGRGGEGITLVLWFLPAWLPHLLYSQSSLDISSLWVWRSLCSLRSVLMCSTCPALMGKAGMAMGLGNLGQAGDAAPHHTLFQGPSPPKRSSPSPGPS